MMSFSMLSLLARMPGGVPAGCAAGALRSVPLANVNLCVCVCACVCVCVCVCVFAASARAAAWLCRHASERRHARCA
jgi:hypothetical protein